MLVPIQLEQASAVEPYFIKSAEDDIIVNPTFSYKMDAEHGVKLPEYNDDGLTAYLEKVKRLVAKLQWTVTDECKIGIFSFLKINMYRDLKDNAKAILANQNVRQLLGEPAITEKMYSDEEAAASVSDPLIELHSVVDADSSQIEAIEMAKSGKSFVLQGPPGTGKSQTITNIIAECLSDGKKVLFVSEKLAAIKQIKRMLLRIFAIHSAQGKAPFPRKRTLKLLSRKRHNISWMPMRLNFTSRARSLKKACISCMNLTPHFGPRQMLSFLSLSLLPKANRT